MNTTDKPTTKDIEAIVLESLQRTENRQEKLLSDYDRLSADTKKAFEDLAIVKNTVNDAVANLNAIKKLQLELRREEIRSFGDPFARFAAHEPSRNWLNACMRRSRNLPLTPEQRTAVTGVDSGVGAAVTPQETAAMIYDALATYGQWTTFLQLPIGSRTDVIPLISVRPTAYWVAQGAQITEGAFTGTSVTLTIKEAAAWIPVARALLDDSSVDMTSWVLRQLAEAVAYRMDWACFAADGTNDTTDGAYTGIAVGGTAAGAAAGNTTVTNLELDDFVRCLTTISAGLLQRAQDLRWWIHPQILAKICLVKDANNRPIFQNALEAPAPGAIGSILGYPVILASAMPSTDAASQVVACFGDRNGAVTGVRRTFEYATSDDFQFDYNRTAFRVIFRGGFVIIAATNFAKLTLAAA